MLPQKKIALSVTLNVYVVIPGKIPTTPYSSFLQRQFTHIHVLYTRIVPGQVLLLPPFRVNHRTLLFYLLLVCTYHKFPIENITYNVYLCNIPFK